MGVSDAREYIHVNYGMVPPFEPEVLEETERYMISRNAGGVVTRALNDGTASGNRASMDQYLRFPVETPEDFRELKKRYVAAAGSRYPVCWRARECMGTENVSFRHYLRGRF